MTELERLRDEVEALRAFVEARAQAQENMTRAMLLDSVDHVAEALEGRIQLAAREAIAYAEQRLSEHDGALAALGRRLAELTAAPAARSEAERPATGVAAYLIGEGTCEEGDCRRLDIRDDNEPVFLADLAHLPIAPGGAAKLVVSHVVEYVDAAALAKLLTHWRSRLAPGGELVIRTLDGPAWAADLPRDDDFERLRRRLGVDGAGRPLRHLISPATLAELLVAAGLAPEPSTLKPPFGLRIAARRV